MKKQRPEQRFTNQDPNVILQNGLINALKWRFGTKKQPWPQHLSNTHPVSLPASITPNTAAITFINHATVLMQCHTLTIITDPVFSERVSPVRWLGPKRVREPGLTLAQLPKIDVVTISHNHYDHMDLASLKKLQQDHQPLFIVPLGNASLLKKIGITKVIELAWWQSHRLSADTFITLVPAQHWSGRTLRDRNKTLWGGFIYEVQQLTLYFAGDTGYNQHFKEIYQYFGAIDLCLLPIGAYEPRWFMKHHHINPAEAVLAHQDLHAHVSIGMHFGTFSLTNEAIDQPINDLNRSLRHHGLSADDFKTLEHGETYLYRQK